MATETAIIPFETTSLLLGPDAIAAFESSCGIFDREPDRELLYSAAKRVVSDDADDLEDDEDEDEDDDEDEEELEDDEDEEDDDEEEDEDEFEDDDDDEEEDEDEDEDVDELQVDKRR